MLPNLWRRYLQAARATTRGGLGRKKIPTCWSDVDTFRANKVCFSRRTRSDARRWVPPGTDESLHKTEAESDSCGSLCSTEAARSPTLNLRRQTLPLYLISVPDTFKLSSSFKEISLKSTHLSSLIPSEAAQTFQFDMSIVFWHESFSNSVCGFENKDKR